MENPNRLAFTLIELLVVIAIIGILSGLIVVTMGGVTDKANIAKSQVFSNSLRNALMMNMVAQWSLDEGAGTIANDIWKHTYNGTLNGFSNTTAGYGDSNSDGWMSSSNCVSGTCLKFNGIGDYVSYSSPLLNATAATVCAWVKRNTYIQYAGFVSDYATGVSRNFILGYESPAGTVYFWVGDEGSSVDSVSFSSFTGGTWHYLCGSFVGSGRLAVYMDGVSQSSKTTTVARLGNVTSWSVGLGRYAGYFFNGSMDDARIYDAAIPVSQIKEQYYAGLNGLLANGAISQSEYSSRMLDFNSGYAKR